MYTIGTQMAQFPENNSYNIKCVLYKIYYSSCHLTVRSDSNMERKSIIHMYVHMIAGIISGSYLYLRHAVTVLLQPSKDQGCCCLYIERKPN